MSRSSWSVAAVFALLMPVGQIAPQGDLRTTFENGNSRYRDGDYESALADYLAIVDHGVESGPLYYNVGNTYFKLGDLGRSILYYERALRLVPGDEDTLANLDLARSLTSDAITPMPRFWLLRFLDWWTHLLPRSGVLALVAVAYVTIALGIILRILSRRPVLQRLGLRLATASAVVFTPFAINLAVLEFGLAQPVEAIVLADQVSVQGAPSEDPSLQVFTIHEGTKVRVDEQSNEWVEIVLADGKVGWVKKETLEEI